MNKTIGFIGAGNMGGAIIQGLVKNNLTSPDKIYVYDKNKQASDKLSTNLGIKSVSKIHDVCSADIIILAIKPDVIYSVIDKAGNESYTKFNADNKGPEIKKDFNSSRSEYQKNI